MNYIICALFILVSLKYVELKLIGSTTLKSNDVIVIDDRNQTFTMWIQIRHLVFQQMSIINPIFPLIIIDQLNNMQLLIKITKEHQFINIIFIGEDKNEENSSQLSIRDVEIEWIKFSIHREICFNRIVGSDIDVMRVCDQSFQATLFLTQMTQIKILLYDSNQFDNQYVISQLQLHENFFQLDVYKDELQILTYVKLYCYSMFEEKIFEIADQRFLFKIEIKQEIITITIFNDQNYQIYTINQIIIQKCEQWNKIFLQFEGTKMVLQLEIDGHQYDSIIKLEEYQIKYSQTQLEYKSKTNIYYFNNVAIYSKMLVIHKIKNETVIDFCNPQCYQCKEFQCLQYCRNGELFNETIQACQNLNNSIIYDYFLNQKINDEDQINKCQNCQLNYDLRQCSIFSDQQGNQDLGCKFQELLFNDVIGQLEIKQNIVQTLDYELIKFMQAKMISYESDLEIIIIKNRDIHLIFYDMNQLQVYCVDGYHENQNCKKNIKQCWFQKQNCILCRQKYSFFNQKCIKCQSNCLACTVINKLIKCILFVDNYFLDNRGLLNKCNFQQNILICQDKDLILENLINSGHKVCQNQIYSIANDQCLVYDIYKVDYNILEYPYYIQLVEQKLQIQDMIAISNMQEFQNKEIKLLINLQQILKMIKQLQSNILLEQTQNAERQSLFLHLLGIQQEDFIQSKITLNVKIILGLHIEYQNHMFTELIEIYKQLNLSNFKFIQYNLFIIQKFPQFNQKLEFSQFSEVYLYSINYENYPNITFIFNITFQSMPRTLFIDCNQFCFKANKVIINNLTFVNQSFVSCNSEERFIIHAQEIRLQNINLQGLKQYKLFQLSNFQILEIINLQIYESTLQQFIIAKSFKKYISQNIKISNISIFNSQVWQFIQCEDVQYANFIDFYIYQSIIEGLFIEINGDFKTIIIANLVLVEVGFQTSMLFSLESAQKYEQFVNNLMIQDIFIVQSILEKSILFNIQEIEHVKISHIYVSKSELYEVELIQFNKQYLHIDNIYINSVVMMDSNLIKFQGLGIEIFQAYILINFSESSIIFYFYTGNVYIQNIHFFIQEMVSTGLLSIKSKGIILNKIIISNQTQSSVIQNCSRLLEIQSIFNNYVYIQNIRFQNLRVIDSIFLILSSENKLTVEKLFINNLVLITRQIKQLILMYQGKKILEDIYIINTCVKAQVDEYTFIQFGNEIEMIEVINLKIINLENQQPLLHVFIIKNEFAYLKIKQVLVTNILNIRLLISESCLFRLLNGQISDIENAHKLPLIFCWEKTIQFRNGLVIINTFQLNNFSNGLIQILGIQSVVAYFQNIHFYDSKLQRDVFILDQIDFVSINNISINNKENLNDTNKFLFYINSYFLVINQIQINNFNQQFLFLTNFKILKIKNVYISNIQSNNLIELRSNISKQVIISNLFIQRSLTFFDSLFKLNLILDCIIIRKVTIINVNVKNEIFSLQLQKQSQSKISDVIIKNVISQNRLFYCTSSISHSNIQIINTTQLIIFQNQGTTKFSNGLITNIFQESKFSDSPMTINGSEIVNSNIIQNEVKLYNKNSFFEGINRINRFHYFNQQDEKIKIYISLNQGGQMFKYKSLTDNLFQVQFDDRNNYLYLPSGRDVQFYRYFNYKTQSYQRLYDSISFINIYQGQQITCILSQSIDNYTIVQKHINVKPGLNIADNLIFTLDPNYKDKYIQMDLNCSQNQQFITYRTLVKTFNCQLGEYIFKEQCLECNIEQQLYSVGYNQEYCLYKDSNKILELKLGQIKLLQQYWRFSYANKYIEQCPNENCQGGWQTGDQSCQIGYIGGICQECDIDNIRGDGNYGKIDNQCYICYFDQKIYFKGLLLIIYQLLLVCISYYSNKQQSEQYLFLRISQRKFTDLLQRQNVDQVTILLKLYYNYLFTIFILKDLFNFGYIISVSLNFIYNPNITAVPQFDCLINSAVPTPIQYTQLLYKIIIPLVLFNISVVIYVTLVKFGYIKYSIYIIFVSLYTIYQQNQIIIIQSLIKLSSKVKYSNIYWTLENLAVQYYSQIHQHYMYVLILPLIGIFTLIFITLIQIINQRIFNKLKLSLLIFKQYKQQFTFWDQIRTLFIYLFMLTYYSLNENYTIMLALTFATITLIQPFQLTHLNRIDLYIQAFSLYSYFAMLISQEKDQYLSYFAFILSNSILLKMYLKYLQHGFNIQYKKLKLKTSNLIYKKIYYKKYVTNMDKQNKIIYYFKLVKQNRKKSIKLDQAIFETNSAHQVQELKSQTNIEIEMAPIHYMFTEQ